MTTSDAFDRGAAHYDLMVALNPGYHRELRRAARALVARSPHSTYLDLACGSGASTRALVDAAAPGATILGLDASAGMLAQARAKDWPDGVRFARAVAGELDVDALGRGRFDGVQTCYLFRNVPAASRVAAIGEVFDLLRPGGWLVVQEYSVAGDARARRVWDAVCHGVIIPLGWVVDRNRDLYRYLWRSVVDFDTVARFADRLAAAGFADVAYQTASGWQRGILHTFVARKPEE
ncbi:class I SAM-dependent methyltransferase [Propioniciclava sp.]|uniref:class I SAM-dependent methyltransferase n=1 Tax=Propioniciclava sp. TaxID=2038686 RepID=UPI0026207081|nr:class I SAM-dependent methyltransferase [Propioniciclava sp.]